MATKAETVHFLNKELKDKSNVRGHIPVQSQRDFVIATANKIDTKTTKRMKPKGAPDVKPK